MSLRISFSLCLSSRAAVLDISFRLRIKDESRRGAGKNRNRVSAANKPLWVCWRPLQGLDLRKLVLSCARGKWRRCSVYVCWSAAGAQSKQKVGRPRPSRTAVVGLVSVPAGVTPCRWIFIFKKMIFLFNLLAFFSHNRPIHVKQLQHSRLHLHLTCCRTIGDASRRLANATLLIFTVEQDRKSFSFHYVSHGENFQSKSTLLNTLKPFIQRSEEGKNAI